MNIVDANGASHSAASGRFVGHTRFEASPAQVLDPSAPGIDKLIRHGFLSPAAAQMAPREAVDQWCEANAATLRERTDLLAEVGLLPRLRADELVEGDAVDLTPIVEAYSGEPDPVAAWAAESEYAVIEAPTTFESSAVPGFEGRVAVLHTDQGDWAVPDRELVEVMPHFGGSRCSNCGMVMPSPEHDWEPQSCTPPATLGLRQGS